MRQSAVHLGELPELTTQDQSRSIPDGAPNSSSMNRPEAHPAENRVLLLISPTSDADRVREILNSESIAAVECDTKGFLSQLAQGAACVLVSEELLSQKSNQLADALQTQPAWSDLPVLLLASEPGGSELADRTLDTLGQVVVIDRPFRARSLLSAVRSAMRTRRQQYTLRTHLLDREASAAALARRTQELARSNAELEQFASIVSHDLRSPLLSLTGCVELLAEQYQGKLGAEADELIGFVTSSVHRMNEMIKSLLDYSRAGSRSLNVGKCDLDGVLKQVMDSLSSTVRSANAQITHDALPAVRADSTQMSRLFQNLIENAIKYQESRPPQIHISAEEGAEGWTVSIRDNGLGIPPEHTERIFKVFQRLHGDDSPYKGVGIGLAICKKIVERHDGQIWVESQPGQGSTFRFTLPR